MFRIGIPELIILFIIACIITIPFGITGSILAGVRGRSKVGWFALSAVCPIFIILVVCLKDAKKDNVFSMD